MSARNPKLKYQVGLDDSDAQAGFKRVRQGLKDLDKTNSQVLDSFGSALGVNTQKIEQMTSAVRGLGMKMEQAGNAGVKAFGSLLKSITPLGGAIAGLGLSVAVAGFRALKEEADNFKGTIDGLNLTMATEAYISTYKQYMHDMVSETGQSVAEAEAKFDKWMARAGANAKTFLVNSFTNLSKNVEVTGNNPFNFFTNNRDYGWRGMFNAFADAIDQTMAMAKEADEAAARNEERGSRMADIRKEEIELDRGIRQTDAEIAKQIGIASDKSKSITERAAAELQARTLTERIAKKQTDLAERRYALAQAMDDEAANSLEDTKATAEYESKISDIEKEKEQRLRKITSLRDAIAGSTSAAAKAAKEEADAMKAELDAIKSMQESQAFWASSGLSGAAPVSGLLSVKVPAELIPPRREDMEIFRSTLHAYFEQAGVNVHIGFLADTEKLHEITNEVQSLMGSFAETTGEAVGSLVGDLLSGGDAWGNFGNAALSAMGDMAQSVGKIAISTGIATLGIKASLETLNGWAAIAAGTALVALGAAVKAGLSNVASGNYGASANVASSSYSSSNSDYAGREITVKVGGTLEADGNKLIAVINNTNKRNYYTTGG